MSASPIWILMRFGSEIQVRAHMPAHHAQRAHQVAAHSTPLAEERSDMYQSFSSRLSSPRTADHWRGNCPRSGLEWVSSAILLATLIRQAFTQWKSREVTGVSRWLFVGQVTASVGFTVYSLLLGNWVYAVSNIAIVITAIVGEGIYLHNKRAQPRRQAR